MTTRQVIHSFSSVDSQLIALTPSENNQKSSIHSELRNTINNIRRSMPFMISDGNQLIECVEYSQITNSGISSLATVMKDLKIRESQDYFVEVDFPALLNNPAESTCQDFLNGVVQQVKGLDASNGRYKTHQFTQQMQQRNGEPIDNISALTGKIDFVSSVGPMFIEIKVHESKGTVGVSRKEIDVLHQALNRVYRLRCSHAQLRTVVGFAITASHAWCIIFESPNP